MANRKLRGITAPAATAVEVRPVASVSALPGGSHYAASGAREFGNWTTFGGSPDADVLPDLDVLRARSRDLARNHGIASGGIQTLVDNVVGTGLRLSATPDYRALGQSKEWAEEWAGHVESLWRSWAETRECDAAGCLDFHGLTTQIFRGGMMNGEGLCLPLWLSDERSRFRTRLQVIEADRLSNPLSRMDGKKLASGAKLYGGIEQDAYGRPLAYWIRKTHPGERMGWFLPSDDWERIPAETSWGRARVLHVHDKERSGQSRGKPVMSAVAGMFKMLDQYQRTELQAAVVNALVAAVFETPLDPQSVSELVGNDPRDTRFQEYMAIQRQMIAPLKGGAIITPPPGSKLSPFLPGRPSDSFAPFVEAVVRHIGTGLGLPLELLLKDFSKTNYSSARAALLEAWRFFLGRREWLSRYWCAPVYSLWLEEAVSLGLVDAPAFYEHRYAYVRCKWIGPGRGWIDPVKEAQAAQLRIDSGLSTLERECAEQGLDWEEVMDQRERERARQIEAEKRLGAPLFSASKVAVQSEDDRSDRPQEQAA